MTNTTSSHLYQATHVARLVAQQTSQLTITRRGVRGIAVRDPSLIIRLASFGKPLLAQETYLLTVSPQPALNAATYNPLVDAANPFTGLPRPQTAEEHEKATAEWAQASTILFEPTKEDQRAHIHQGINAPSNVCELTKYLYGFVQYY